MIDFAALKAANARLNAFVEWDEDASFGHGPLAGCTVGVKSNIAVKGLAWSAGLEAYRHRIAQRDATAVARVRNAGAAIIGTLNMDEAALGAVTRNPHFGSTGNPHAPGHTAGGSSGGSAAAVAAGLCDLSLGSDTLGSVRIPAAYCGIYGFKPANDRVSQDGLELAEPGFDCIGPLARSLDLLERCARLMSAFGEEDADTVVTLADLGGADVQPEVQLACDRAAEALGARQTIALDEPLSRIRYAAFVRVAKYLSDRLHEQQSTLSAGLRYLLTYGPKRSGSAWEQDQAILASVRERLNSELAEGAVLLTPTAPQVAFPDSLNPPPSQSDFTCLANIAGLVALSLPAGTSSAGLPIGVQLLAAPGREAGLFRTASRLDSALNAYRRPSLFLEGVHA